MVLADESHNRCGGMQLQCLDWQSIGIYLNPGEGTQTCRKQRVIQSSLLSALARMHVTKLDPPITQIALIPELIAIIEPLGFHPIIRKHAFQDTAWLKFGTWCVNFCLRDRLNPCFAP